MSDRGTGTPAATEVELAASLAAAVGPAVGDPDVRIEELRLLSGGASRETWSFDAVGPDAGRRPLILQRLRGGMAGMEGPSLDTEDALLAAAAAAGVPVPEVVVDATRAAAHPGLEQARITARVDGETLGPRIVRDDRYAAARAVLAGQAGRALAAVHAIDPGTVPGLRLVEPLERVRLGFDLLGEARPAFELALRWLAADRPPAGEPTVVHGDFRVGNLVVDDTGLRAVLDWELAHLGDPLEDLGWLCVRAWRFGGDRVVGGVGDLDQLLDAYRTASGRDVDPDAVRWWMVAGTLTWGLICAVQARRHLDGHVRSVELATIGRRVCETEYDLLQLIGVGPDGVGAAEGDGEAPTDDAEGGDARPADAGLHGRPTAEELVEAVRDHLVDRVAPELDGSARFHLRVASNALAVVARELRLGPQLSARQDERLAALGFADEAALAAEIRSGNLDGRQDVAAVVRAGVIARLRVANPKWLEPPDRL